MLLKQEDCESNLLPWHLYPSLSLLVYLAEDLDIKKNPRSFYLILQRKPACSLQVLLRPLFVKVVPCGFSLKAVFSKQSKGPFCTRPSAIAALHNLNRPVGAVIQRSLKPLHGGCLEGIHHQRHQVPSEAAAALRTHWVPLVRHSTRTCQRRKRDANRATAGVRLGRRDEGPPPGKKNVSGIIDLTKASKHNHFLKAICNNENDIATFPFRPETSKCRQRKSEKTFLQFCKMEVLPHKKDKQSYFLMQYLAPSL